MKRDSLPFPIPAGVTDDDRAAAWRVALPALALALLWICAWYATTAVQMIGTWANTETYAHGFVVVPICLWLIWRARADVSALAPRASWTALPLLAVAGLAWLIGQFGAVNALAQAAFVSMLVLSVPVVLGWDVARALAFPLAFLFFAVPVGDFLLPTLMDRTADFTVAALRASGVPVYREGMLLVLPTGRWSIVEACSGVRYLIASLMAGTLFAYLNYRALWRRWAFVGVSIVTPIVANWLRAYMIVMLGHLSNNRIATGVDHLIYGWIFFGFVMLLMFWVGSRWREPAMAADATRASAAARHGAATTAGPWLAASAVIGVTLVWPLAVRTADHAPLMLSPVEARGWQRVADEQLAFEPKYHDASAVLRETLQRGDVLGAIYIAYYRDQDVRRKLVSSMNVLVQSEDWTWIRLGEEVQDIDIGAGRARVVATQLRSATGQPLAALHWYWIDGTVTANPAYAKALTAWSRLRGRGDDSAAVILYATGADQQHAQIAVRQLARDAWPAIATALASARQPR